MMNMILLNSFLAVSSSRFSKKKTSTLNLSLNCKVKSWKLINKQYAMERISKLTAIANEDTIEGTLVRTNDLKLS